LEAHQTGGILLLQSRGPVLKTALSQIGGFRVQAAQRLFERGPATSLKFVLGCLLEELASVLLEPINVPHEINWQGDGHAFGGRHLIAPNQ
jgi:hypothetical protein